MQDIVYRGSFRYADRATLERALIDAREHLDDDELSELDRQWMRHVFRAGTTLRVDASLPVVADRYVAAAVLGALAGGAIEGHVDVRHGDAVLDAFVCELA